MAVASKDLPRLHILVRQCIKDRVGLGQIVQKMQQGLEGAYHTCGYTDTNIDLALLTLRLGGRSLLYAVTLSGAPEEENKHS